VDLTLDKQALQIERIITAILGRVAETL